MYYSGASQCGEQTICADRGSWCAGDPLCGRKLFVWRRGGEEVTLWGRRSYVCAMCGRTESLCVRMMQSPQDAVYAKIIEAALSAEPGKRPFTPKPRRGPFCWAREEVPCIELERRPPFPSPRGLPLCWARGQPPTDSQTM